MAEDDPGRRRVLAAVGAAALPFLSGCGLFQPPDRAEETDAPTRTSTPTPTATSTPTTTATSTPTQTATPEPTTATPTRFDPGDAITVDRVVFGDPDVEEDGVQEYEKNRALAVVDVDVVIRNASSRSLGLVSVVVDVVYETDSVSPVVVATGTVSRRWPDGLAEGATATLSPDPLYFEQTDAPWHDLRDDHYSVDVTVRVVEPL